jgi:hypothetical protein
MKSPSSSSGLFVVAVAAWLLVLPASVFLAVAGLRLLQPAQYEPARTSWVIFEWTTTHISHGVAALLFLGLPSVAAIAGCVMLLLLWRGSEALRQDVTATFASLRRHLAVAILGTGTLLACAILAAVVMHLIAD